MDKLQILADISALQNLILKINKREPNAIAELNRLYRLLFGEVVVAGCTNCHIKAYHRLIQITLNDLTEMENQNFKLKKGVRIEYPFNSGQNFTAKTGISNEKATEMLINHPELISRFEVYPGSEDETPSLRLPELQPQEQSNAPDENLQREKNEKAAQKYAERKTQLEKAGFELISGLFTHVTAEGERTVREEIDVQGMSDEDFAAGLELFNYEENAEPVITEGNTNPVEDFTEVPAKTKENAEPVKNYSKMSTSVLEKEYATKTGATPKQGMSRKDIIKELKSN